MESRADKEMGWFRINRTHEVLQGFGRQTKQGERIMNELNYNGRVYELRSIHNGIKVYINKSLNIAIFTDMDDKPIYYVEAIYNRLSIFQQWHTSYVITNRKPAMRRSTSSTTRRRRTTPSWCFQRDKKIRLLLGISEIWAIFAMFNAKNMTYESGKWAYFYVHL